MKRPRLLFFVLLMFAAVLPRTEAQTFTPQDITRMEYVYEQAISPTGEHIAYRLVVPRPIDDGPGSAYQHLYVIPAEGGDPAPLLTGKETFSSIAWTPGGEAITFRAKLGDDKTTKVYKIDAEGGDPEVLLEAEASISSYELLADGETIFYTHTSPSSAKAAKLDEHGFDMEFFEEDYKDINLYMRSADGETTQLTEGFTVFEFDVSPDGNKVAAQIEEHNLVDYELMFKRIFVIDLESGEMMKVVDNPGKLTSMAWSPDSRHIAFAAGKDKHDAVSGQLYVADASMLNPWDELFYYSEGFEGSVEDVAWLDNETVLYSANEGVDVTLRTQKIGSAERGTVLAGGKLFFNGFSRSGDLIALGADKPEHPREVFTLNTATGEIKRLTHHNKWLDDLTLGKQEKIEYEARDGLRIEGVLVYPVDYEEGKTYPLITYVHGGPESNVSNGWYTYYSRWGQSAAGMGFFVFMPNYRASSGRGNDFVMAGFGDPAGKEFEDVIDGIDYLIAKGLVDKDRVGIGGGSYGGYFTAWGASKYTDRFAAGCMFVGVSNLISTTLSTDIPQEDYLVHMGKYPHEDFEFYLERSPISYTEGSRTPLLILHGSGDPRVPPLQSKEMYRSLKLHGDAPVRLVLYPGEGHGNRKNINQLDYHLRTLRWFDYYLNDRGPQDELPELYLDYSVE